MVSCPIWVWQITDECCTTAVPLMPPGWSETGQLWSVITELYWGNTQHLGDWSVTASNISSVYALPLGFSTYPSLWLSKSDRGEQLQWDMTQGSLFSCHSFQREHCGPTESWTDWTAPPRPVLAGGVQLYSVHSTCCLLPPAGGSTHQLSLLRTVQWSVYSLWYYQWSWSHGS